MIPTTPPRLALMMTAALVTVGCGDDGTGSLGRGSVDQNLVCDLDLRYLADGGVGRDGIPALTDPTFRPAQPRTDDIAYFRPTDRIVAYWSSNGDWLVIPHNLLYRHEIVNLPEAAITYCPLTGSALAFARGAVGGAEFGVSGLLYNANLILYDRNQPDESLWPQMWGEARCGPRTGTELTRVPVFEMTYEGWLELHPDSKVLALSEDMFDPALYFFNPYGDDYDDPDNGDYLGFPMIQDTRRPPKERVLGIPDGQGGGLAFPFLAMAEAGELGVFDFEVDGEPAIVLWDGRRESAMAFHATVNGQPTTFRLTEQGVMDDATETIWAVDGSPVGGTLEGTSVDLRPVTQAYVAFWRAWAAFHPATELALGG